MSTMVAAALAGGGLLLTTPVFAAHLGLVEAPGAPALTARAQLYLAAPTALRHSPAVAAVWSFIEGSIAEAPAAT